MEETFEVSKGDRQARPRRFVQAVDRALDILFCLSSSSKPLSLSEISRMTELDRATAYRLLQTLESRDLAWRDPSRRYSLGPAVLRLTSRVLGSFDLRAVALPHMQHLAELTQETVGLAVMDDHQYRYIAQVESPHEVRWVIRTGVSGPLHTGAASRAMLAFLPDEEREAYVKAAAFRQGEIHGVQNRTELRQVLSEIANSGVSFSVRETPPTIAMAAPVFSASGRPIAAITVGGPTFRVTREILESAADPLLKVTREISRQLGYQ